MRQVGGEVRVSRRSFLGGAIGSMAMMFGGFGWRGEEVFGEEEWKRGAKFFAYGNPKPPGAEGDIWANFTGDRFNGYDIYEGGKWGKMNPMLTDQFVAFISAPPDATTSQSEG